MARQRGIIKIEGNLGGLSFYELNGEMLIRTPGGFTRQAIRNKPSIAKVRANMSEFGLVSALNKKIRQALLPLYVNHKDGTLHMRLQQLLIRIKNLDEVSARGQRLVSNGFATPMGRRLLEQFEFTPAPLNGNLLRQCANFDTEHNRFTITDFDSHSLHVPDNAMHIELRFGILGIDFDQPDVVLSLAESVFILRGDSPVSFTVETPALPVTMV